MFYLFITLFSIVVLVSGICSYFWCYVPYRKGKEFVDFNDCPFKFIFKSRNGEDYIVFKFDKDMDLWCGYDFGVRGDGIYGIEKIMLKSFNGDDGTSDYIPLKVGQSVFPLLKKMTTFEEWLHTKSCEYSWGKDLSFEWKQIQAKLDNLQYLETKSKERDDKNS